MGRSAAPAASVPPAEPGVTRRVFANGLTLLVQEDRSHPLVAFHAVVRTGSATEGRYLGAGISHVVEHMLFKGTARRGVGEAAAAVEGLGGDLNAWTSYDETCFHATLAAGSLVDALDVVFDMCRDAALDAAELEREKQVVIEEIHGYDDEPDSVAADRVHALVFGEHPYGRPVIGFERTVERMDRAVVEGFWRRNYHPGRATLSIAGPVDVDEVRAWVRPWIARWPVGEARGRIPPVAAARRGVVERLDRDFGSVVVELGWPGPAVGDPDGPVLDVLMQALGGGASSRLQVLLDLEGGLASHVWADAQPWIGGGLVGMGFLCGETEEAITLAVRELGQVARHGLSGPAVARARDAILADLLFTGETAEGVAGDLAWWVARTGDPLGERRYRASVAAVTADDVRRVAARWLDPDAMRAVVIDRELRKSALDAAVRKGRVVPPARRGGPGVEMHQLGALRVAVLPDPGEIAAVKVLAVGGQLLERSETAGLSDAWSRFVLRGAGPHGPTAFAERTDALGAQVDAGAGRSTVGVTATFPAGATTEVLGLVGDVLVDPHFGRDDWPAVKDEILDDLATLEDRPHTVATDLLWRALFPGHPWRLPTLGTATSVRRLAPDDFLRFHRATFAASNVVIAVTGGVDPDAVLRALEPLSRELPERPRLGRVGRPDPPVKRVRPRKAGREQATVVAGVRGVAIDHPMRTPLVVATNVLDSQSGRLFLRLREARGLAYAVWARSDTGVGGGAFSAGLATEPSRAGEAWDALLVELRRLAEEGPAEDELRRNLRMLEGLAAMRLQRVAGRATELAHSVRFGLPYGLDALRARLAEVTPSTVRAALQDIGLSNPVRITVLPR